MAAMKTVVWTVFLLAICSYIVAIVTSDLLKNALDENPNFRVWWYGLSSYARLTRACNRISSRSMDQILRGSCT